MKFYAVWREITDDCTYWFKEPVCYCKTELEAMVQQDIAQRETLDKQIYITEEMFIEDIRR